MIQQNCILWELSDFYGLCGTWPFLFLTFYVSAFLSKKKIFQSASNTVRIFPDAMHRDGSLFFRSFSFTVFFYFFCFWGTSPVFQVKYVSLSDGLYFLGYLIFLVFVALSKTFWCVALNKVYEFSFTIPLYESYWYFLLFVNWYQQQS